MSCYDLKDANLFFLVLWFIWLAWNKFVFSGEQPSFYRIYHQAHSLLEAFGIATFADDDPPVLIPYPTRWTRPKKETLKVNVDAGYRNGIGTAGVAIHDHTGSLIAALTFNLGPSTSIEHAELTTILEGVMEAARVWSGPITIESDSLASVSRINGEEEDISHLGTIIGRIRDVCRFFSYCRFDYVWRSGNTVADSLAKLGFSLPSTFSGRCNWGKAPPSSVLSN